MKARTLKLDKRWLRMTFSWARKLHLWTMWLVILLGGVMAVTGLALEDISEGEQGLLSLVVDPLLVKEIHRSIAEPFAIILGMMIGTGLVMWLVPRLMKMVKD